MIKGKEQLPNIVLEIGINANGSALLANEIMGSCLLAADIARYPTDLIYFKFQKRDPGVSTPKHMWDVIRRSPVSNKLVPYIEYKKEIEFGKEDYQQFEWVNDRCGGWFTSVWDIPSVDFISQNFPFVPYIKIPSAHLTNEPLINKAAETKIPLIVSTGMSTRIEMDVAIAHAIAVSYYPITVLSCTATYPCKDEEINFFKLNYLREANEQSWMIKHGFSSHSPSPFPAIYSCFFDVDMVEVHVTADRTLPGSDQAASLEYNGILLMFREILRISKLYGDGSFIFDSELEKKRSLRGE